MIAQLAERIRIAGYAVLPGGFSQEDIADFSGRLDRVMQRQVDEFGADRLAAVGDALTARCPLAYDEAFVSLAAHSEVLALCRELLGDYIILMQQNGVINPPHQQHTQLSYHRDLPYQHFVSSRPLAISALFCIDPFRPETGATTGHSGVASDGGISIGPGCRIARRVSHRRARIVHRLRFDAVSSRRCESIRSAASCGESGLCGADHRAADLAARCAAGEVRGRSGDGASVRLRRGSGSIRHGLARAAARAQQTVLTAIEGESMKILFVVKQKKNVDTFMATIRALVGRGHEVVLAVQERSDEQEERYRDDVASPLFSVVPCPPHRADHWAETAWLLRSCATACTTSSRAQARDEASGAYGAQAA
jgi:hypothetical protein